MDATRAPAAAPARPVPHRTGLAVAGTVVTVLALVSAAVAVLGFLLVLFVLATGLAQVWGLYGLATAVIAGPVALVLGAGATILRGDRQLVTAALVGGLAAPAGVALLMWTQG